MTPSTTVGLCWLLFGGTHVGLATRTLRARLVARLGTNGFLALYSAVAAATFAVLVGAYAALRDDAAPGIGLGGPWRWLLFGVVAVGMTLAVAGVVPYPASSYALFRTTSRAEPRGLERVTRHPFFVGTGLVGIGHALLAEHLVGTVFFAGLAVFSLAGARHQDRKLLAERGAGHAAFMAQTSSVPFAAIFAGRTRLTPRELPWGALALGVATTCALRAVHPDILARGGAWVVLAVIGGALLASIQSWQREAFRRRGALERSIGPALVAIGVGHAACTLLLFPDGIAAITARGVAGAITLESPREAHAAFWFGLFAPALVFMGWVASHALAVGDRTLLELLAWFLFTTAVVGVVVMPVSGFWAVLGVSLAMMRVATPRPCNAAERPL
jgi:uncharacterized membrane protein